MVNFKVLISSVKAGCKRQLIMESHLFSSFSNTNLIVWLNVFASQKFLNIIIVFILHSDHDIIIKRIAKYGKFVSLKCKKVPYLQAQVLRKKKKGSGG